MVNATTCVLFAFIICGLVLISNEIYEKIPKKAEKKSFNISNSERIPRKVAKKIKEIELLENKRDNISEYFREKCQFDEDVDIDNIFITDKAEEDHTLKKWDDAATAIRYFPINNSTKYIGIIYTVKFL